MKRLLAVLLLLSAFGFAQTTCVNCSGTVYTSGGTTANVIPKSNGSSVLQDSPLLAPDANTVRQANTTTAQVSEIYGTTDSNSTPVNYEKLMIGYNALSVQSTYQFVTTKGGSGTNRGMDFFLGAGNFGIGTTTPSRTFVVASSTGVINTYAGVGTAGQGVVAIRGTVLASTGQVGSLGATTILTGGAATAGLYRVCYQASTTTSGTGTTGTVTVAWNDGNAKSFTTGTWALNAVDVTGQVNGCQTFRVAASQNITVATTIGAIGTSVYRVDAQAEQLQ